jgi:hypothetical protein
VRRKIFFVGVEVVAALMLGGCGARYPSDWLADDTGELPARFKIDEPVPIPDFADAARSPAFQQAIRDAATRLSAEPKPLPSPHEEKAVAGGVSFDVAREAIEPLLHKLHTEFLTKGFFLFRYEQNFGIGGDPDKVGLVPTDNKYDVVALMATSGNDFEVPNSGVIKWMKELERQQPFLLTGISYDHLEGAFTTPIRDADGLAERMYQFCPDIVDQGTGTIQELARELRTGHLYFWWD